MRLLSSIIRCGDISFPHYYLCSYLPRTVGKDALSLSLLKFKQRFQPDLDAWTAAATDLLDDLPFSPDTIIVRALRHNETVARPEFPCALDLLGHSLAARLHCRYLPALLIKTRPTLPGKFLTRNQRRSQLESVYQLAPVAPAPEPGSPTPFLLIDDILTSGSTMRALIHTLRNHYPACAITAFTLTRAGYQSHSSPFDLAGIGRSPAPWQSETRQPGARPTSKVLHPPSPGAPNRPTADPENPHFC
jgi:predicted amidophosphoribosyltransferase